MQSIVIAHAINIKNPVDVKLNCLRLFTVHADVVLNCVILKGVCNILPTFTTIQSKTTPRNTAPKMTTELNQHIRDTGPLAVKYDFTI